MSAAILKFDDATIFQAVRGIRTGWSPRERRVRATEGRHRFQRFLDLIAESPPEPEVWAVGAPAATDLQRLVGQH